jgi:hypothetical protein
MPGGNGAEGAVSVPSEISATGKGFEGWRTFVGGNRRGACVSGMGGGSGGASRFGEISFCGE